MPETVGVYFDYLCPFAWRGAELAAIVAEERGIRFEWHHFSLYQSNQPEQGQVWNERIDPEDPAGTRGLLPFLASCAARRQGPELHDAFRLALMRARHRDHRPFTLDTIMAAAECSGLHLPRFESDLADPECRTLLAQEHHRAASLNVFGTPTFEFEGGHLAYFRLRELPQGREEALRLFSDYRRMLEEYPYLETVKRPRAPGN